MIISSGEFFNNEQLLGESYTIHSDPRYSFTPDGGLKTNFDYYLMSRTKLSDFELVLQDIAPEKILMNRRIPKRSQMAILHNFGIPTPRTAFCHDNDIDSWSNAVRQFPGTCESVVVKYDGGARGVGQARVPTKFLYNFIKDHIAGKNPRQLTEDDYYSVGGDGSETALSILASANGRVIVQECLDIEKEWRILYNSAGHRIILERIPNHQNEWQCKMGIGGTLVESIPMNIRPLLEYLSETTIYGSVDVFQTTDGSWGVFEYCTQFGFSHPMPLDGVCRLVEEGLKHSIAQKVKSNQDQPILDPVWATNDPNTKAVGGYHEGN